MKAKWWWFLFAFVSCTAKKGDYKTTEMLYFSDSIPYPDRNPPSINGVLLGEQLFFEKSLSGNNQIACATCHLPDFAFADTMALTDRGVSGKKLPRNTPTLYNLAWAKQGLFWDGGAKDLESLSFAPLSHADEMGQDLKFLPLKLMQKENYKQLFKQTFSKDTITNAMIARALAQYVRTLIADSSKYDSFVRQKVNFNDLEMQGMKIFNQKCMNCHVPPFFTDFDFHQISKDKKINYSDNPLEDFSSGRFRITGDSADLGKFKTPTLRNWILTYPYLHDGSAKTMQEAVYAHQNLIIEPSEMKLLVSFLNTLNEQ